jgi:hypothetical protein
MQFSFRSVSMLTTALCLPLTLVWRGYPTGYHLSRLVGIQTSTLPAARNKDFRGLQSDRLAYSVVYLRLPAP